MLSYPIYRIIIDGQISEIIAIYIPPTCCKLHHIMLYTSLWSKFKLTTSVVIGTDCIGSCKSNYHSITAMTAPVW